MADSSAVRQPSDTPRSRERGGRWRDEFRSERRSTSPSPRACGERVGVRGWLRKFERCEYAESPPHPDRICRCDPTLCPKNLAECANGRLPTNRPSLELSPYRPKAIEPEGERGTDPVSSSTRTVAWALSPNRARKGAG